MPYIKRERREAIRPCELPGDNVIDVSEIQTSGELNFAMTELAKAFLKRYNTTYGTINEIMGAFEGAKNEFYRRVAAPYEDRKIQENGDVYPEEAAK